MIEPKVLHENPSIILLKYDKFIEHLNADVPIKNTSSNLETISPCCELTSFIYPIPYLPKTTQQGKTQMAN